MRPENTLAAFDHGLALGADGLELDVHLSRDGVVVVHHDPTLERTTNGSGAIRLKTAAELAGIDAGYRFQLRPGVLSGSLDGFPYRGKGIGVPTLREVLARYRVPLIIELKTPEPRWRAPRWTSCGPPMRLAAWLWDRSTGRGCTRRAHYEPRMATGAAREETRWALYKSWLHWPLGRAAYREFQVPECRAGRGS